MIGGLFGKRVAKADPARAEASAFDARFATPTDACQAALDLVASKLPNDLIDWAAFGPAWTRVHRDGRSGITAGVEELSALLPPDDAWPTLAPVCWTAEVTPSRLFLMTLGAEAGRAARREHRAETARLMPYLLFQTVGDAQTCPEHQQLDGSLTRVGEPSIADWRWGCRCSELQMSSRMAAARGLSTP